MKRSKRFRRSRRKEADVFSNRRGLKLGGLLAMLLLAAVAASASIAGTSGTAACTSKATWTSAEINKVATFHVDSVFKVPKCHPRYTFAFLNLDESNPTFADVAVGLRQAAKFYGVKLLLADLKKDTASTASVYEQLAPQNPTVVGTVVNPQDGVLLQRAQAHGAKVLLFGGSYANPPTHTYMLKSTVDVYALAGGLVGKKLGTEAKKRLAGPWRGKSVIFIEAGQSNFPTVVNRETAAEQEFTKLVNPAEIVKFDTNGDTATTQQKTTAVMQSHPGAVFVVAPLNDEVGLGAAQAFNLSSSPSSGIVAGLGGDQIGRNAIRSDTNHVFIGSAYVAVQPRSWNWIEAAIAIMQHHRFTLPPPSSTLTWVDKTNIDKIFTKKLFPNG
jgi:ABC-type sugar transport system substrate-binding protein